MNSHITTCTARVLAAGTLAWALASTPAAAAGQTITVKIHVSSQGLDLRQPVDVQTFYTRIRNAAYVACTRANRVGLEPVADQGACEGNALGTAVRDARLPLLTQVYLASHTPGQAAAYGIGTPSQMAAK